MSILTLPVQKVGQSAFKAVPAPCASHAERYGDRTASGTDAGLNGVAVQVTAPKIGEMKRVDRRARNVEKCMAGTEPQRNSETRTPLSRKVAWEEEREGEYEGLRGLRSVWRQAHLPSYRARPAARESTGTAGFNVLGVESVRPTDSQFTLSGQMGPMTTVGAKGR